MATMLTKGFELVVASNTKDKSEVGDKMKLKIKYNGVNCRVLQIITSYIKSSKKYLGLFLIDLIDGDEFTIYHLK